MAAGAATSVLKTSYDFIHHTSDPERQIVSTTIPSAAPKTVQRPGDRIFSAAALGAGITILVTLAGVALFLIIRAFPAFTASPEDVRGGEGLFHYIAPLIFGTLLSAVLALAIALPLSIGIGIFISHYAPRRLAMGLGYLIDLLAAVPSIVFGLWGGYVFAKQSVPVMEWLNKYLGWFPLFSGDSVSATGRTMFVAVMVLAIMILPIMTAVNREVFLQTPRLHEEAAYGLGATRWEMIKLAVIPYGRSGVISGAMLGLGRALGETMAVAMIVSAANNYNWSLVTSSNAQTIAADIALTYPEAAVKDVPTLIAAGLALFVITLAVNMLARWVATRGAAGGE